jgi:formyl-CoA transferase
MQKPLTGVRVLEITGFLSGPFCALQLAALGAEVIKIEPPGQGDATRHHPPFAGPRGIHREPQTDSDMSLSILKRAAGRRSITLNLKQEQGRQIFFDLLQHADVVLENLRPGALQRLGLDYGSLQPQYPGLIYCSISGYGQTGPYSDLPAHDPIIQATSGLMSTIGSAEGEPTRTGNFYLTDMIAALYAALTIVAAVRQRDTSGNGQYLDVSMFDCLVSMMWDEPYDYYLREGVPIRTGNRSPRFGPINTFPTKDGRIVILAASDEQWNRLLQAMGREDLGNDPRCATGGKRGE